MRTVVTCLSIGALLGFLSCNKLHSSQAALLSDKISSLTTENTEYASAVEKQNNAILSLRIASTQRQKEYAELLKQPEKIKYIELKSDNCEDVRSVLDDIRTSGF